MFKDGFDFIMKPVSPNDLLVKLSAYKAGLLKIIQADLVSFLPS